MSQLHPIAVVLLGLYFGIAMLGITAVALADYEVDEEHKRRAALACVLLWPVFALTVFTLLIAVLLRGGPPDGKARPH